RSRVAGRLVRTLRPRALLSRSLAPGISLRRHLSPPEPSPAREHLVRRLDECLGRRVLSPPGFPDPARQPRLPAPGRASPARAARGRRPVAAVAPAARQPLCHPEPLVSLDE